MDKRIDEALPWLDPSKMDNNTWVKVGAALKLEGYPESIFIEWSRQDPRPGKFSESRCHAAWRSFNNNNPNDPRAVKGGTIIQMAIDAGMPNNNLGTALDWTDVVINARKQKPKQAEVKQEETNKVVNTSWVEDVKIEEPGADWSPTKDLADYLSALFNEEDIIGYVTEAMPETTEDSAKKWKPAGRGIFADTAGTVINGLNKYPKDITYTIGTPKIEAGAWIRFNPLDGKGVSNTNVKEYRYALVESDNIAPEKQLALIRELHLPCAAIVDSGNKSIHAIVKIDAGEDYQEYQRRVDFLYKTCTENGLTVDTQNKNASRLSRMPGVMRGKRKQWLIATNEGCASWGEWREWLAEQNDDLPDPECLADVWDNMPELSEPLIEGVVRRGHKLLVAGPSKAGKSFSLIELCIAIAEERNWLGFDCHKGSVMYVNLELDRASCLHRFKEVYEALGCKPENIKNIDIWNLRGKSKPMDSLVQPLVRRALKTRPSAIIIDPIYKVITGDENSASEMALFCNQFDILADAIGSTIIYCHHHSKGSQGQKRSMDRASGSGVFARDPDALLDIIQLHLPEAKTQELEDEAVLAAIAKWLKAHPNIEPTGGEELLSAVRSAADKAGLEADYLAAIYEARKNARAITGWRVEGTLREFAPFEPINVWFKHPVHEMDRTGYLKALQAEGEGEDRATYRAKGREKKAANDAKRQDVKLQALREGIEQCAIDGVPATVENTVERMPEVDGKAPTPGQVRNWVKPGANKWCSVVLEGAKGKQPGVLVDKQMVDVLEGW